MRVQTPIPELSVVIPIFNERDNIIPLWNRLTAVLPQCCKTWEVLWIDDGSTDGSQGMLAKLRCQAGCRVFRSPTNRGQSAAFWSGFQYARGPVVITMDGDLQNDPEDIPLLVEALEHADLVAGWRRDRHDPMSKRLASRFANSFRNWLTNEEIADVGCSLKAFRREVLEQLVPFDGMHRFYPTLAKMAGFRVAIVPVRHHRRKYGRTKYGILDRVMGPLQDCLVVRWMKRRYLTPCGYRELCDD